MTDLQSKESIPLDSRFVRDPRNVIKETYTVTLTLRTRLRPDPDDFKELETKTFNNRQDLDAYLISENKRLAPGFRIKYYTLREYCCNPIHPGTFLIISDIELYESSRRMAELVLLDINNRRQEYAWDVSLTAEYPKYTVDSSTLEVPKLQQRYVSINGVSFKTSDLRLFYNTWLYDTLVKTGEKDIVLPNISIDDLKLLRDVLTGNASMLYVYHRLSDYTYRLISGDRTMFDVYDGLGFRHLIDMGYDIGLPLVDQLTTLPPDEVRVLGSAPRQRELIDLAKSIVT